MWLRTCSSSYSWLRSASNSFLVVIVAVVFTVALGAPSNGLCPVSCRCLERNTVITCSNLVHVPWIPSIAVKLNLDHNRISLLQNTSFRSTETTSGFSATRMTLRRLEVLSIEDNGLLYIEAGALSTLYELRVLRLGRNHLSSLPRDLLASNRKLRVLDLHANYLAVMPDGVVRHAHGLVVLNISFNHLSSARLGDGFRHAAQLSVIDLSGIYKQTCLFIYFFLCSSSHSCKSHRASVQFNAHEHKYVVI
jgi:Leucine rich repeat